MIGQPYIYKIENFVNGKVHKGFVFKYAIK